MQFTAHSRKAEGRRDSCDIASSNKKTPDFKNQKHSQSDAHSSSLIRQLRATWRKEIEAEVAVELRNAYIGFEKQLSDLSKEEDLLLSEFAALTDSSYPTFDHETLKIIIENPSEAEAMLEREPSIAQLKKKHIEVKRELVEPEEDSRLRERMLSEQRNLESTNQELKHLEAKRESLINQIGLLERTIEAFHASKQTNTDPTEHRSADGSDEQLMKTVMTQENNEVIADIKFNEEKLARMEHLTLNLTESNKTLESALTPNDSGRNLIAYEQYFEYIVDQYEHFLKEVIADEAVHLQTLDNRIRDKSLAVETSREGYYHIKQKELEEYRRGERKSFSPVRKFISNATARSD